MKKHRLIIGIILFILFCAPLFWFSGNMLDVGGDDTRLYFMAPENYISNFSLYVWNSYNSLSDEYTPWHGFPFIFIPLLLKKIGLAVGYRQMLLYGATLMLAFLSAYVFIMELVRKWAIDIKHKSIAAMAGGLLYIFSPIILIVDWQPRLPEIYGLFIYPLLLYFFILAVNRKSIMYLACGAVLSTIFSFVIYMAVPWFVGFLTGAFFLLAGLFVESKEKKRFAAYLFVYICFIVLVNSSWISILIDTFLSQTANLNYGKSFAAVSISEFIHNVQFMNVLYAFLLLPAKSFYGAIGSVFVTIISYKYSFIFLMLPMLLTLALIYSKGQQRKTLLIAIIPLLALSFCITVNITDLGAAFFGFLIRNAFGFAMFKNFQTKFSISHSFFYAVAAAVSLAIVLSQKWRPLGKYLILFFLLAPFILPAKALLKGDLVGASPGIMFHEYLCAQIPESHFAAMEMLKRDKEYGRVFIFPVARYLFMAAKCDNQSYYVGTPYVKILSGKECFEGILSFHSTNYAKLPDIVYNLLDADDYGNFFKLLWIMNIKYTYMYEEAAPESAQLFLFKYGLVGKMKQALLKELKDKELGDFGDIKLYRVPYDEEPSAIMAKINLVKVDDEEWLSKIIYTDFLDVKNKPLITY